MLLLQSSKNFADNVAVINAPDLAPIMKHTDIKEIREIVQVTGVDSQLISTTNSVSVSMKIAELPTTTQIEVCLYSLKMVFNFNLH